MNFRLGCVTWATSALAGGSQSVKKSQKPIKAHYDISCPAIELRHSQQALMESADMCSTADAPSDIQQIIGKLKLSDEKAHTCVMNKIDKQLVLYHATQGSESVDNPKLILQQFDPAGNYLADPKIIKLLDNTAVDSVVLDEIILSETGFILRYTVVDPTDGDKYYFQQRLSETFEPMTKPLNVKINQKSLFEIIWHVTEFNYETITGRANAVPFDSDEATATRNSILMIASLGFASLFTLIMISLIAKRHYRHN